jgi:serine/threonine protein kinase
MADPDEEEEPQHAAAATPRSPASRADARAAARAPLSSLKPVRALGEGAFSSVDLVTLPSPRSGGCPVSGGRSAALKRIKTRRGGDRRHRPPAAEPPTPRTADALLRSEREAHTRAASSPFVAHAFALKQGRSVPSATPPPTTTTPTSPPPLALLLEYHPGGDVQQLLERRRRDHAAKRADAPYLSETEARFVAACALVALEHLHLTARVIHRDCKPANLFVSREGYVVLGDLGCAAVLPVVAAEVAAEVVPATAATSCLYRGRHCAAVSGTRPYMAPEVRAAAGAESGLKSYGAAADLYSLGVAVFELASGEEEGHGADGDGAAATAAAAATFPSHFSSSLRSLLSALLSSDPLARPTAAQAQAHGWFDGFDWPALKARTLQPPAALVRAAEEVAAARETTGAATTAAAIQ